MLRGGSEIFNHYKNRCWKRRGDFRPRSDVFLPPKAFNGDSRDYGQSVSWRRVASRTGKMVTKGNNVLASGAHCRASDPIDPGGSV